ncbi:MAG: RNA-binding protein [Candidatus Obscuribacterales bacterium]|nr:RNA-binding protein [Candidatus Obscuribacterales bacterium]
MNNEPKKLFVGNLPFSTSEEDLQKLFEQSGSVSSVSMPLDRETGRKRGFAFVEMETQAQAEQAVKALNGMTIDGRQIAVNASQPRDRSSKRW